MAAHAEHFPHHHDDDGKIAFDDSTASASHQLDFDYGTHFQAPLPADLLLTLAQQTQPEPLFLGGRMPAPPAAVHFYARLKRPSDGGALTS